MWCADCDTLGGLYMASQTAPSQDEEATCPEAAGVSLLTGFLMRVTLNTLWSASFLWLQGAW